MTTEKQARRKYSEEFKRESVTLVTKQDYKISKAARNAAASSNDAICAERSVGVGMQSTLTQSQFMNYIPQGSGERLQLTSNS